MRQRLGCNYEQRPSLEPIQRRDKRTFACNYFEAASGYEDEADEVVKNNLAILKSELSIKDSVFTESVPIRKGGKVVGKTDKYRTNAEINWSTGEILAIGDSKYFDPELEEDEYSTPIDLWVMVANADVSGETNQISITLDVTTPESEKAPIEAILTGPAMDNVDQSFADFTNPPVNG